MDIRQLIDTINHFENKQILNEGVVNNMTEGGNFDEQELSDVLKAFDEQVNGIGGNGQPDYDKIMSALDNRDIESAMEEIVSAYSDQDGGEISSNDYDNYLEDLESEFKFLVYSDPTQRVSSTRPLVIRSDDKRATFNPTQFDDNGQRDNRVSEGNDQTSIYKTLIKEFGYELNEEGRGSDEYQAAAGIQPKAAAPAAGAPADNRNFLQKGFDSVVNFHKQNTERFNAKQAADAAANSPEGMAAAKAKLTPSQLAWLGNTQPSPEILQRMPAPRPGETAPAAAPAPSGYGLKPPKYGGLAGVRPLDGSDDRRVNGQGLKMPAQAPVTSVAAAQAALGAEDNPEAAMGAGSGAAPVAANKPAAAPEDNPEASMGAGSGAAPVAANKLATAGQAATPEPAAAPTSAASRPVALGRAPPNADGSPQTITVSDGPPKAAALGQAASPAAASTWKGQTDEFGGMESPKASTWTGQSDEFGGMEEKPKAAGAEATKIARFKELLGKAKAGSVTPPAATKESVGYFLNKLRFIESRQLNEELTPEEQKEIDGLYAELGQQGSENNPELTALINDYNSLPKSAPAAGAAAPAFNARKDSQQFQDKTEADTKVLKDKLIKAADEIEGLKDTGNVAKMKQIADGIKQMQADPNFVTMAPVLQNTINDAVKLADAAMAEFNKTSGAAAQGAGGTPAAPAAATSAPAAATSAPAAAGRPADAAAMANAPFAFVQPGSDEAIAIQNGYGPGGPAEMAKWRAAGSPGKSSQPAPAMPPVAAPTDVPRDANGVNIANKPGGSAVAPAYKGSAGAQEIQKLNPAIKDVNKIYPGQKFKMPDGSTYTVKPGDTLDKIAKGAKPAGEEATTTKQQDQISKAPPPVNPLSKVPDKTRPPVPAPAAPSRKELDQKDLDRIKQLSGATTKPGKLDLSVMNPAMNPVNNAPNSGATTKPGKLDLSVMNPAMNPVNNALKKESIRNQDDAILERIRSALRF